jgi:tetratricopeptide (TPR) repeat protein
MVKVRPKAEFLWHNKGITLEKLDRTDEALQCYKKAIALDSGCADLHYHYGIVLYERDDFQTACNEFNKALQIRHDDSNFLLWKARALAALSKTEEARQIVNFLIADNQKNADAWFVLGRIEKDDATALPYFQKAYKIRPKHGGALCSSAACLSNLGKFDEALDIFLKMGGFCPRHEFCETLLMNICTTIQRIAMFPSSR